MRISYYKSVFDTKSKAELTFKEFIKHVKNGRWQDDVLQYRSGKRKKETIPAVASSGTFSKRSAAGLTKHSGIINIDVDAQDNERNVLEVRDELYGDPFVLAGFISVSGKGISLFVRINGRKHKESFLALEEYFSNNYKLIIDEKCKYVSRLRFVSYDPDAYYNESAVKWTEVFEKERVIPDNYKPFFDNSDVENIVKQCEQSKIDLTFDYYNWIKIGFALANEYGEQGRNYFHRLSSQYPDYDSIKVDKKYDNLLKTENGNTTIGTLFWLAKQNNIAIFTKKTQNIVNSAINRRKSIGKSGGAKNTEKAKENTYLFLNEFYNIKKQEAKNLVDEVFNAPLEQIKSQDTAKTDLDIAIDFVKSQDIIFNEVKHQVEVEGKDITDRLANSVYLNFKTQHPNAKIGRELMRTIIDSDRVASYHPFKKFFEKVKNYKPDWRIDKVIDCFNIKGSEEYQELAKELIFRWLLSIISSAHGIHSTLVLVLVGKQNTGKTKFFRNLLPPVLQEYYAESKMDKGKDDDILATKKLLILDDEFSGKSKKEYASFKDKTSKQYVTERVAYAHYHETFTRYGVFGGTSNELEILNDPTGNRRILPIFVKNIDIDAYKEIDKEYLFAELYNEWLRVQDNWMLDAAKIKEMNKHIEIFYETTIEEDVIATYYEPSTPEDGMFRTTAEMITFCEARLNKQKLYHKRFSQILRKMGFEKKTIKGKRGYYVIEKD